MAASATRRANGPTAATKGRGTVWAIEHRYSSELHRGVRRRLGHARAGGARGARWRPATQVIEEHVKSILSRNDSPDIAFDLSINPYRGCEHGCIYCFARPTHSYLNLSPGLDFETRIIAKVNAAERLREAFASRGYEPRPLNIGSATDAYQPVERRAAASRARVIEVLAECRASVLDHHQVVGHRARPRSDRADGAASGWPRSTCRSPRSTRRWRASSSRAPRRRSGGCARSRRWRAPGVPVGVSVSPVIPFINEPELERVLEAARDAGATLRLQRSCCACRGR